MNSQNLETLLAILQKDGEIISNLIDRIQALEETVIEQAETIRGLTVDTEMNTQSICNLVNEQDDYRCELTQIGAEIDTFMANERNQ